MRKFKSKIKQLFFDYMINVIKSDYDKRVLISYITKPFYSKSSNHTNHAECRVIAQIFDELGYCVDVVDYQYSKKIDFTKYEVIFGFGNSFENSFKSNFKGKRINYCTGSSAEFQNLAELKRVRACNVRRNQNLQARRLVNYTWPASQYLSDAVIVVGNQTTLATYKQYDHIKYFTVNLTPLLTNNSFHRDYKECQKNFVWFGSAGCIHKGLDICLEFFSKHPELNLFVYGAYEDDFMNAYKRELDLPNIFYRSFIDVQSEEFFKVFNNAGFAIFPTCSEGQSTALLTSMATGLIPIATRNCGIDFNSGGLYLTEISEEAIIEAITRLNLLSSEQLLELSEAIYIDTHDRFNITKFKQKISEIIVSVLQK